LPDAGCPMAHCDVHLSGRVGISLPQSSGGPFLVAHDTSTSGSGAGLGCASNGSGGTVACSLNSLNGPNLVVYNGDGVLKWNSSNILNFQAASSAPLV